MKTIQTRHGESAPVLDRLTGLSDRVKDIERFYLGSYQNMVATHHCEFL